MNQGKSSKRKLVAFPIKYEQMKHDLCIQNTSDNQLEQKRTLLPSSKQLNSAELSFFTFDTPDG